VRPGRPARTGPRGPQGFLCGSWPARALSRMSSGGPGASRSPSRAAWCAVPRYGGGEVREVRALTRTRQRLVLGGWCASGGSSGSIQDGGSPSASRGPRLVARAGRHAGLAVLCGQAIARTGRETSGSFVDNKRVPTTFVALAVAVLAVLPGAAYLFAFESRSGPYKVSVPDRLIRFLVASAGIHALFAGITYYVYRSQILTGRLAEGKINPWMVELVALAYAGLPYLAGLLVGTAYDKDWRILRWAHRGSWHPRAWDHVFSEHRAGYVRLRLKSGDWIAGLYAKVDKGPGAYASAYGEEPDLFLSPSVKVDSETGEFEMDKDGIPISDGGSLLIRWAEVEYAHFVF